MYNCKLMKCLIETDRLALRPIVLEDAAAMFDMDADPKVHLFLGNKPVKKIEEIVEVIAMIQTKYQNNGMGRWAVIEKQSNQFIGWCGINFISEWNNNHINFYDLGYRLNQKFWGKGYATEAAKACVDYGFNHLQLEEIIGQTHDGNEASKNVLRKCGFIEKEKYVWEEWDNALVNWFVKTK